MTFTPFIRCVGIGNDVYQTKMHTAYDHRMICILRGDGSIHIEDKHYKTTCSQVYFIKAGTSYRVCSLKGQRIAVINFDGSNDYSHISEVIPSVYSEDYNEDLLLNSPLPPFSDESPLIFPAERLELFGELYKIYMTDGFPDERKAFALSSLFGYIVSLGANSSFAKRRHRLSDEIYRYTADKAEERITVSEIASHFNYSASYVERIIRRDFGISIKQIIIQTRMKKALWMLENTDISCESLSAQLGFFSCQHFSQAFKKYYGKNPTDFR